MQSWSRAELLKVLLKYNFSFCLPRSIVNTPTLRPSWKQFTHFNFLALNPFILGLFTACLRLNGFISPQSARPMSSSWHIVGIQYKLIQDCNAAALEPKCSDILNNYSHPASLNAQKNASQNWKILCVTHLCERHVCLTSKWLSQNVLHNKVCLLSAVLP